MADDIATAPAGAQTTPSFTLVGQYIRDLSFENPGAPGSMLAGGAGGLMLLLPGYFSDIIGILLLLPPTRSAIYAFLKSRIRVVPMGGTGFSQPQRPAPQRPGVIDLDDGDYRQR